MRPENASLWLGLELNVEDKEDRISPDILGEFLREEMEEFLSEGKQNRDFKKTGKGVDLFPVGEGWEDNPLFFRYQPETWFDMPESRIGRIRTYTVWFPVKDFMEHHELDAFKEMLQYIIGDKVWKEFSTELDVGGVIITGSEESVRDHYENTKSVDIDWDSNVY